MTYKIPKEVLDILERLEEVGSEAYLVGGCVRDLLLGGVPKDWDVTTDAKPEEIQKAFSNTFYENDFGTVGVVTDLPAGRQDSERENLKVVEVTPYRMEAKYSDKRHPDIVKFSGKLEDDLKRRDFTINAMAIRVSQMAYVYPKKDKGEVDEKLVELVDLWKGKSALKQKLIKTVGNPGDRFNEDALRILRAVRLAAELDFEIDKETEKAITKEAHLLKMISKERIRDEFTKILMTKRPHNTVRQMNEMDILQYVVPELEKGIGVGQNKGHIYTVWEHNLRTLKHAAEKNYSLAIRWAALLHDVGKPRTKRGEGPDSTFYNHEMAGARMTAQILSRLKYPKKFIEKVMRLVRWHLFFSDTDVITLSAVRRIVRNVGPENIWDLMKVRFCDRVGMGRPKEEPYRLRKYESMIEEALRDPISVKQLKVNGEDVMRVAKIEPSSKVGFILHALLEEVLDDPKLNTKEYLEKRVVGLGKLSEDELKKVGISGIKKKTEKEQKEVSKIRQKYHVK